MKVIIEKNIPFIQGYLDNIADVSYLSATEITADTMKDADALITRTRTRCDSSLLEGSKCRFIATATIGTDHIDLEYCRQRGITVANAPGCNAPAVAQYVFASIASLIDPQSAQGLTLGIVGVGHVGSIVERWGKQLGFHTLICDPPRQEREGDNGFSNIDTIFKESDIITFHTPLVYDGKYPTYHILNDNSVSGLKKRPVIINSARGPVTDSSFLSKAIDMGKIKALAIDCWENEPNISATLLEKAAIATPHIAGYSREGKIRATQMALDAFTRHFKMNPIKLKESVAPGAAEIITWDSIITSYSPIADTEALKQNPSAFESLRNNYVYRHEAK